MTEQNKVSIKRIIGAAFFGLILGGYLNNALKYTVPIIFSIINKTTIVQNYEVYTNSPILLFLTSVIVAFFAGSTAGFLARRKGVVIGLLANSIYIIMFGFLYYTSVTTENFYVMDNISLQLYSFITLISIMTTSILGGYCGQKIYSSELDLDLRNEKLTIFGIRWFHYLWVLPFIIYSFLATAVFVIYDAVIVYLAEFYYIIHPSIWFSAWILYFVFIPMLTIASIYLLIFSFGNFWKVMQFNQLVSKGWRKFGKVLLYGFVLPAVSFFIASIIANITHNMPSPVIGDWKIGIGIALIFPIIYLIIHIFSWIKKIFSKDKNNL